VDVMLGGEQPLWGCTCIEQIEFRWDQWMLCVIVCAHGRYSGESDGAREAIPQSLERAAARFHEADVQHRFDW